MPVNEWLPVVPEPPLVEPFFDGVVSLVGKVGKQDVSPVVADLGKGLY